MGAIKNFFSPPKPQAAPIVMPAPLPAPVQAQNVQAPSKDNSAADLAKAEEKERRRLLKKKGRSATILTSNTGVTGDDSSGLSTKRLLGG